MTKVFTIKKFLFLMIIGIVAFMLSACDNSDGDNNNSNGVWGSDIVDSNLPETEEIPLPSYTVTNTSRAKFYKDDIYNSAYASLGLLVIKNSTNHIGFYSLQYNNYIVEKQFYEPWLEYEVFTDRNIGFFISVYYDDVAYLYDSLGNKVYEGEERVVSTYTKVYGEKAYLVLTLEDSVEGYQYSANGNVSYCDVDTIYNIDDVVIEENEFSFNFGSMYVDVEKHDLTPYGLPGYYASRYNNLFSVFSSDNKVVSTFYIPQNAIGMAVVDKCAVYQIRYQLPDDSENFSYSLNGLKYHLETYKVDLFNGAKVSNIDANFIIQDSLNYKNTKGEYAYLLATILQIDSNKVASQNKVVILDKDCHIIDELTGYEPSSFIKLGDSYFNTVTKVLYDSKLKEIAYLAGMNPSVDTEHKIIFGKVNGLWGVVDSTGKVVVPFEFSSLSKTVDDYITIGVKDGEYHYVNTSNGTIIKANGTLTRIEKGLYSDVTNDCVKYTRYTDYNTVENYYVVQDNYSQQYLGATVRTTFFNDTKFVFSNVSAYEYEYDYYDGYQMVYYFAFTFNDYQKSSFTTFGNEVYYDELDGTSYSEAPSLYVTETPEGIHQTGTSYNYYKFTPEVTGTYTLNLLCEEKDFVSYNKLVIEIYDLDYYEYTYSTVSRYEHPDYYYLSEWEDARNYTYDLVAGQTYYFVMKNNTDAYYTYTLVLEDGSNVAAPIIVDLVDKTTTLQFAAGQTPKYYRLACEYSLYFTVSPSSFYDVYDGYYQYSELSTVRVNSGSYTYINVYSSSSYSGNVKFTAQLSDYIYGSSPLEGIALTDGSAITVSRNSGYELSDKRYFVYTNSSSYTKTVTFYADNYMNVTCSKTGFYATNPSSLENEFTTMSLSSNETVYFVCDLSLNTSCNFAVLTSNSTAKTNTLGNARYTTCGVGDYAITVTSSSDIVDTMVVTSAFTKRYLESTGLYNFTSTTNVYVVAFMNVNFEYNIVQDDVSVEFTKKYKITVTNDNEDGGSFTVNGNVATVTFDSRGGSSVASQTVSSTTPLKYPDVPSKSGYVFTGWYTTEECVTYYDFNSDITYNLTLYAGWERADNVGYSQAIIDSSYYSSSSYYYSQSISSYSSYDAPYYFYTSFLTSGTKYLYYKVSSSYYNIYLYVYNVTQDTVIKYDNYHYNTSYNSVSFNVNAGDVIYIRAYDYSNSNTLYFYFENAAKPTVNANVNVNTIYGNLNDKVALSAVVNPDYRIVGWYRNGNALSTDYYYEYTISGNADLELSIELIPTYVVTVSNENSSAGTVSNIVNVTFDSQGGSSVAGQTVSAANPLKYPSVPTRNGYAFSGWYTEPECQNIYDFNSSITSDITLYAKWVSMVTSYYSREYIDVVNYNNSSSKKTVYAYSNSSYNYYYFTCYTSGTYTVYETWTQGDFYFVIYNATTGVQINSYNLYSSYPSKTVSFTANAGDVIYIRVHKYSSSSSTGSGTFYITGASYPTAGGVSADLNGDVALKAGTQITLVATPNSGYTFKGWYRGDTLVSSNATYTYTMTEGNDELIAKWY